jgi:hypothetical protein
MTADRQLIENAKAVWNVSNMSLKDGRALPTAGKVQGKTCRAGGNFEGSAWPNHLHLAGGYGCLMWSKEAVE